MRAGLLILGGVLVLGAAIVWFAQQDDSGGDPTFEELVPVGEPAEREAVALPALPLEVEERDEDSVRVFVSEPVALPMSELVVTVLDASDAPIPKAFVGLRLLSTRSVHGQTSGRGQLVLKRPTGVDGWLSVTASGVVARAQPVAGDVEQVTVRLDPGVAIQGRLTQLDRPPRHPVRLSLISNLPSVPVHALDDELSQELAAFGAGRVVQTIETGEDGRFQFPGRLPSSWTGTLMVLDGYVLSGTSFGSPTPPGELLLSKPPPSELFLELQSRPCLTGRIVEADGDPVAEVGLEVRWSPSSGPTKAWNRTESDGRFVLLCDPADAPGVTVIATVEGTTLLEREITAAELTAATDPTGECDLGNLEVVELRNVSVRVRTEDGMPPRYAFAEWGKGGGVQRVEMAGGMSTLELGPLPLDVDSLAVGMKGYLPKTVRIGRRGGRFDVMLEVGARFVVDIRTSAGEPADGLFVMMAQAVDFDRVGPVDSTPMTLEPPTLRNGEVLTRLDRVAPGRYVGYGVVPGHPLRLEARPGGPSGRLIESLEVPPAPEAKRSVEWHLATEPTELVLRVVGLPERTTFSVTLEDEHGRAISSPQAPGVGTGPLVTFPALWHQSVKARLRPTSLTQSFEIRLHPGRQEEELILDLGRQLVVDLHSHGELAFQVVAELHDLDQDRWRGRPTETHSSHFVFSGLDMKDYRLVVTAGGWLQERRVSSAESSVAIDLPAPVDVDVLWDDTRAASGQAQVWLVPESRASRPAPAGARRRAQVDLDSNGQGRLLGIPSGKYQARVFLISGTEQGSPNLQGPLLDEQVSIGEFSPQSVTVPQR